MGVRMSEETDESKYYRNSTQEVVVARLKELVEENDHLKRLCRFQYLTLGYYGTHYNYDPKNIVYNPTSGEPASGVMSDGGHSARQAHFIARDLGFDGDDICSWPGPGVKSLWGEDLEAQYKKWFENRTGKKLDTDNKLSGSPGVQSVLLADPPTSGTDGPVQSL